MSFAGAASGSACSVISAENPRDPLLLQLGVSYALTDTLELGIGYAGRFNEDYSAQAITTRSSYRFCGFIAHQ